MAELNPVLQDPILAIHPPLIYAGYVASAIVFAICLCICIKSYKRENDFHNLYKRKDRIQAALKAGSLFTMRFIDLKKDRNIWSEESLIRLAPPVLLMGGVSRGDLGRPAFASTSGCARFPFVGGAEQKKLVRLGSPSFAKNKVFYFIPSFFSAERGAVAGATGGRPASPPPFATPPFGGGFAQDTIVSGSVLSVIRAYQDWGWKEMRIWTLICWCFLTVGILLGSWWAYHELGWGGWWFWDPVENASFMPWVLSTGTAHSILYARLNFGRCSLVLLNFY
jgi:hypothetical protein